MKVYQLRSYTPEAFHQAVAVSASLSGTDREVMEKLLARNYEKQEKMKKPGKEKNEGLRNFLKSKEWVAAEPLQSRLASKGIKIYITGKEGWKDKISETGRPYRIGFAKAALACNGCVRYPAVYFPFSKTLWPREKARPLSERTPCPARLPLPPARSWEGLTGSAKKKNHLSPYSPKRDKQRKDTPPKKHLSMFSSFLSLRRFFDIRSKIST